MYFDRYCSVVDDVVEVEVEEFWSVPFVDDDACFGVFEDDYDASVCSRCVLMNWNRKKIRFRNTSKVANTMKIFLCNHDVKIILSSSCYKVKRNKNTTVLVIFVRTKTTRNQFKCFCSFC